MNRIFNIRKNRLFPQLSCSVWWDSAKSTFNTMASYQEKVEKRKALYLGPWYFNTVSSNANPLPGK